MSLNLKIILFLFCLLNFLRWTLNILRVCYGLIPQNDNFHGFLQIYKHCGSHHHLLIPCDDHSFPRIQKILQMVENILSVLSSRYERIFKELKHYSWLLIIRLDNSLSFSFTLFNLCSATSAITRWPLLTSSVAMLSFSLFQ